MGNITWILSEGIKSACVYTRQHEVKLTVLLLLLLLLHIAAQRDYKVFRIGRGAAVLQAPHFRVTQRTYALQMTEQHEHGPIRDRRVPLLTREQLLHENSDTLRGDLECWQHCGRGEHNCTTVIASIPQHWALVRKVGGPVSCSIIWYHWNNQLLFHISWGRHKCGVKFGWRRILDMRGIFIRKVSRRNSLLWALWLHITQPHTIKRQGVNFRLSNSLAFRMWEKGVFTTTQKANWTKDDCCNPVHAPMCDVSVWGLITHTVRNRVCYRVTKLHTITSPLEAEFTMLIESQIECIIYGGAVCSQQLKWCMHPQEGATQFFRNGTLLRNIGSRFWASTLLV